MLFNNSSTLGGSKAKFNQERKGLLPLLLHGHSQSVATRGVATGGTVAGVALHTDVEPINASSYRRSCSSMPMIFSAPTMGTCSMTRA